MLIFLNRSCIVSLVLILSACASNDQSRVTDAVTAPLNDLNLVHAEIPLVLAQVQKRPYVVPADLSCPSLAAEIKALDGALGPDIDAPATDENQGLVERGSSEAKNAMVGAIRNTTEGVLPFRGWIRKLTGAEHYSHEVAAAIAAGAARRAFLKGLKTGQACT